MNKSTTIGIATMPEREKALEEALLSLIHQVDNIYVYFNNFEGDIPDYLHYLKDNNDNLKYYFSEKEIGDLTDFGGFYKAHEAKGYFISCDDDLIYPENFVSEITKACERYDNKCAVGYHGRIYQGKVKSYYHGYSTLHQIDQTLQRDRFIHIIAGCAMCFHVDNFKFKLSDVDYINYPRMKDIHLAIAAHKQKVPRVVLAHTKGQFKISDKYDQKKAIHFEEHRNDSKQVEMFNSVDWKLLTYGNKRIKKTRPAPEPEIWWKTNKGGYFKQKRSMVIDLIRAKKIVEATKEEMKTKEIGFDIEYEIKKVLIIIND